MKIQMFGMNWNIVGGGHPLWKIIQKELSYYPQVPENADCITLYYNSKEDSRTSSTEKFYRNPKSIYWTPRILGESGNGCIVFRDFETNTISVTQQLNHASMIIKAVQKFRDIQFYSRDAWAGQSLIENVLIPTIFFQPDKCVLHGSAICSDKGAVTIFGGTGGTGKTSSLLKIAKEPQTFFVCDDLCPVNKNGKVYPNYAYPKIYAYNTINNNELKRTILKNDGMIGKLQWAYKEKKVQIRCAEEFRQIDYINYQSQS